MDITPPSPERRWFLHKNTTATKLVTEKNTKSAEKNTKKVVMVLDNDEASEVKIVFCQLLQLLCTFNKYHLMYSNCKHSISNYHIIYSHCYPYARKEDEHCTISNLLT